MQITVQIYIKDGQMHICVNVQNRLMSRCLFNMHALLVMDARPCAMEARPSHVKGSLGGGGESVLTASTKPITTIADEMGIGRELKVVDGNPREALYSVRGEICVLQQTKQSCSTTAVQLLAVVLQFIFTRVCGNAGCLLFTNTTAADCWLVESCKPT